MAIDRIKRLVELLGRVSDDEYDALLENSVVFLNLRDAPANTTVVECIARNTPILISACPASSSISARIIPSTILAGRGGGEVRRPALIREASQYRSASPMKTALTEEKFIAALQNSAIYRGLPTPASQPAILKCCDVSVVICSYKRVYNMNSLLDAFVRQTFSGSFEVLLWNEL